MEEFVDVRSRQVTELADLRMVQRQDEHLLLFINLTKPSFCWPREACSTNQEANLSEGANANIALDLANVIGRSCGPLVLHFDEDTANTEPAPPIPQDGAPIECMDVKG